MDISGSSTCVLSVFNSSGYSASVSSQLIRSFCYHSSSPLVHCPPTCFWTCLAYFSASFLARHTVHPSLTLVPVDSYHHHTATSPQITVRYCAKTGTTNPPIISRKGDATTLHHAHWRITNPFPAFLTSTTPCIGVGLRILTPKGLSQKVVKV